MEIPIQVAVRIFPHRELKDLLRSFGPTEPKKDAQAVDEGADSKDSEAQVPAAEKDNPSISETDPNGNAEQDSAADSKTIPDANGNDSGQKDYPDSAYCVQAIPISASALGLPSALPGGDPMDSIAAGLIQVGPHTVPVTHALPSSSSQEQVYHQTVFPLITLFLEGFDASVVTYGGGNSTWLCAGDSLAPLGYCEVHAPLRDLGRLAGACLAHQHNTLVQAEQPHKVRLVLEHGQRNALLVEILVPL